VAAPRRGPGLDLFKGRSPCPGRSLEEGFFSDELTENRAKGEHMPVPASS
jgi:hypothetical protein